MARETRGEAVNVACGGQITVNRVIDIICDLLDVQRIANYTEERPGDIKHSSANIQLAQSLLGYQPIVSFEEGIQRAIDYYRETTNA